MGRRYCSPFNCPVWPGAIVGTFKLEDNMNKARITTDNGKSWTFRVSSDVKKAFDTFMKENDTDIVPNYGLAVVDVKHLPDAQVLAFLPFHDPLGLMEPSDLSTYPNKRLSHQKALDTYNNWFEEAITRPGGMSCG